MNRKGYGEVALAAAIKLTLTQGGTKVKILLSEKRKFNYLMLALIALVIVANIAQRWLS